MQKLDTYADIKKYTRKTIFASFLINCIVNVVFIFASCYTYFVLNTLVKTKNIYSIITPTILLIVLYGFTYTIIIKRDSLIISIGRFFDYILFRHLIKIGIIINARTNNTQPAKKLIGDFINIKTFISNRSIIGIFDIPWIFISILLIGGLSFINAFICLFCIIIGSFLVWKEKKYKSLQMAIKSNENYDFIHQLFENSQFVKCNFDYENIIKKTAIDNTLNYNNINKYSRQIAMLQSIIKFTISLSQVVIFLFSIASIILYQFTFSEFVLTIILSNRTLNMINPSLQSIANFNNTKQAYLRINDAIDKTYSITHHQKPQISNKLSIELNNVSYVDYTTKKNVFDNLNGAFVGGEIYVIDDNNVKKKKTFLQLISGISLPSNGNIRNFNIDNGYDFMSYYQKEPTILDATILEFISGFEEQPDIFKINNILNAINTNEINNTKYKFDTILTKHSTYTKGFLKKLNLARIIYRNTNVIILEEPFENIDDITAKYLIDYINTYKKLGKMVILTTENIENKYIKQLNSINIVMFQQGEE